MSESATKFAACIRACLDCQAACNDCSKVCIESPQVKELLRCIILNRDCGLFCHTTAFLLEHGSEFLPQVCRLCSEVCEVCEACAKECDRLNLAPCRRTAKACRHCVHECNAVLQILVQNPAGAPRPYHPD